MLRNIVLKNHGWLPNFRVLSQNLNNSKMQTYRGHITQMNKPITIVAELPQNKMFGVYWWCVIFFI